MVPLYAGIICNPMYDCVSREGDSSTNNRYVKAEPASRQHECSIHDGGTFAGNGQGDESIRSVEIQIKKRCRSSTSSENVAFDKCAN